MAPPVADDLLLSLSAKQRVTVQRSQEVVRSRVLLRQRPAPRAAQDVRQRLGRKIKHRAEPAGRGRGGRAGELVGCSDLIWV